MNPSVYLAGPITGLTYDEATDWRRVASEHLGMWGIDVFSPLRLKQFLREYGVLESQYADVHPLASNKGIVTRDFNDVSQRDMLLVNFLGAERVSIGTVWEIGIAHTLRKPIVVAMEDSNVHVHAMVVESAGYWVETLNEAFDIVRAVLVP